VSHEETMRISSLECFTFRQVDDSPSKIGWSRGKNNKWMYRREELTYHDWASAKARIGCQESIKIGSYKLVQSMFSMTSMRDGNDVTPEKVVCPRVVKVTALASRSPDLGNRPVGVGNTLRNTNCNSSRLVILSLPNTLDCYCSYWDRMQQVVLMLLLRQHLSDPWNY
jgi:hypothetical protein